ncbi:peptidoglycan-binding domain-containing protein [Myxacorys almedinensis]|uniref:Peptidoglycan-binding protein n=1 Tax=Myxacorys almedinensis A TaxID=2690445 RepID=A0A8J7YZD7_9CYAN|nr:peptidoglycan-binding protein [Myxacorys almedinensis]NDJ17339.1 peptidoglycan-binding protein [Myxacorys almedinensis A]
MSSDADAPKIEIHRTPSRDCLRPWDNGAQVSELQVLLNACGYPLRIDGDFGSLTEIAVIKFQQQQGLRVDGVVNLDTWARLEANIRPGARMLKPGHTGTDVRGLQELLEHHGYSVKKDGCFDDATKAVVMRFQQKRQLEADGIVDMATWNQLQTCPLPNKSNAAMLSPEIQKWIDLGKWW